MEKIKMHTSSFMVTKIAVFTLIIATLVGVVIVTNTPTQEQPTQDSPQPPLNQTSVADSIYTHIYTLRLQHPQIVYAQCVLESGTFTSRLFTQGHNCTGMKCPTQRPTTALGVLYGHAHFNTWQDCLLDYAIWQSKYCRDMSPTEYLSYLGRVYAHDPLYVAKLKEIINQ